MTHSRALYDLAFGIAIVLTVLITVGHYTSDIHDIASHNVYRRLYYVPVVLAAFSHGLKGGLSVALFATLAYLPHAFFMEHHRDPAPALDKAMEIVLYLVVGGLTGGLIGRGAGGERAAGSDFRAARRARGGAGASGPTRLARRAGRWRGP